MAITKLERGGVTYFVTPLGATSAQFFQVAGPLGPGLAAEADNVLQAQTNTGTLATLRAAAPAGADDVVTLASMQESVGQARTFFTYSPGGTAGGSIFTDPWELWEALFTSGLPVTVYIDCSHQSPAPWPVDLFVVNCTFMQSPITNVPAVLGLCTGFNPIFQAPSDGQLLFPAGLDGVGVVNTNSVAVSGLVLGGEIFSSVFTMSNGAYIQRASNAEVPGLALITSGTFQLNIDACLEPFRNLADPASTTNLEFYDSAGTLNVLIERVGPLFEMTSFTAPAGATLNLTYDDSVPFSQLAMSSWLGTVNYYPLSSAGSVGYTPASPAYWQNPPPSTVAEALDRIAAVLSAGGTTPIP